MRALFGSALLVMALTATYALTGSGFVGLFNLPALVLIGVAPLCTALISHEPAEMLAYARAARDALRFREGVARQGLIDDLGRLARAIAGGRASAGVQVLEQTNNPQTHLAGLSLLKQYDARAIHELFAARAQATLSAIKRAEDFFVSLARLTPSFGLIGTILGFVHLLQHLSQADQLGPGMAVALTATLYGITASYCVYHPIARALAAYGRKLYEHFALAEHATLLMRDGRGVADLELLIHGPQLVAGEAARPTARQES